MNYPDPDQFADPLENFEPREYSDKLEQALVENEVGQIRHEPYLSVPADTPIKDAVDKLANLHIACLLITDEADPHAKRLVGVFSERDLLNKVALELDDLGDNPVKDVMTKNPIFVNETDSAIAALSVMAMSGYRHVPVVDLDGNLTGVVSPQRVNEFLKEYSVA